MAIAAQHRHIPFDHWIIDDFVGPDRALDLCREFPDYHNSDWYVYDSVLEKKRAIREWSKFPPCTYALFQELCGPEFLAKLKALTGHHDLVADAGLHGAGWHIQKTGDHLNVHLDYDQHPRLYLQRKLNLILYLTPDWQDSWGGELELWSHDAANHGPESCQARIQPRFGRAVIFDTTCNSWHGVPGALTCPHGIYRRSIAMYYLTTGLRSSDRTRALYAPTSSQKTDPYVLDLIQQRSR